MKRERVKKYTQKRGKKKIKVKSFLRKQRGKGRTIKPAEMVHLRILRDEFGIYRGSKKIKVIKKPRK